jgi:hypothetical protein
LGVSNLEEFGKVARLNVFVEYFICLFIIPVFFSYLPDPTPRKLKYLKSKPVIKELSFFSGLVNCYPRMDLWHCSGGHSFFLLGHL